MRVLTTLFHRHLEPGTDVEDSSTMATATAAKAKLKIFPLADRVAIRPMEETETMKGGLYIPDTAKEKPIQGEVIASGTHRDHLALDRLFLGRVGDVETALHRLRLLHRPNGYPIRQREDLELRLRSRCGCHGARVLHVGTWF